MVVSVCDNGVKSMKLDLFAGSNSALRRFIALTIRYQINS
jgi:hypothetical protein